VNRLVVLLKSKTFWGAVVTGAAWLLGQPHVGVPEVAQAVGGIITAAGVRDSITKLQTGEQGGS